jgi:hypothetical protein
MSGEASAQLLQFEANCETELWSRMSLLRLIGRRGRALAFVAAPLCAACTGETSPRFVPAAYEVQGSWGQNAAFSTPGNEFVMALSESVGVVMGTGTFGGEAGPFGALAIRGTATSDSVHLQIVYNFDPQFVGLKPDTAHFDGVLTAADTMGGISVRGGVRAPATFMRLKVGDPIP